MGGLALLLKKGVLKDEECGAKGKQRMTTVEKEEWVYCTTEHNSV